VVVRRLILVGEGGTKPSTNFHEYNECRPVHSDIRGLFVDGLANRKSAAWRGRQTGFGESEPPERTDPYTATRRPDLSGRIVFTLCPSAQTGQGKKHEVAYRLRNLCMDRWNLWPRLTLIGTWKDEYGDVILDGTNNDCERSLGWWIKERYPSMRGYKRTESALNVSRLIAFAGNHLSHGLRLTDLIA
jgi:hypothetical protein